MKNFKIRFRTLSGRENSCRQECFHVVSSTKKTGAPKGHFEQFGGTYRKESDYVIPNLEMSDIANLEIGFYGQRHLYFLQNYRRVTYINLLTNGNLNE